MPRIACLVTLALFAACTDDDKPGDGMDPGSDSGPNDFVPQAGGWHYDETTPISSTCPANTPAGEHGNFAIDQVTSGGFRIVPADGTAPFPCTLADSAFDCPDRAAFTEDYRPAVDAVLSAHATAEGNFASARRASGRQHLTLTCTGSQCGVVFPTSNSFAMEVAFVIETL